ncbi:MIP III precursor, partial [Biomphalaria glabrata]
MSSSFPLVSMLLTTAMLVLVLKVSGVHGVATKVCTSTDRSNSRGLCTGHLYSTIMLACDIFRPVNKRDVMT